MTTTPADVTTPPVDTHEVDLAITGMTCASCSARVERKLGKLDVVEASVNLATERAHVRYAAPLALEDILATVRATGYGASVIAAPVDNQPVRELGTENPTAAHTPGAPAAPEAPAATEASAPRTPSRQDLLKRRALVSLVLAVPVVILAMVPGIHIAGNPWVQLALTTPIVAWAAWPFHRAAAVNARHGASTMDTLVSLGVLAAYMWSTVAVLTGTAAAGMASMADMATTADTGGVHLYFETAAVVTTFLLIGRWLEARAKAQGKEALTTLLTLGATDVAVERPTSDGTGTVEIRIPIDQLVVGERFVVRPGEKVATDGRVLTGESAVDTSLVTGESLPVDVGPGDDITGGTSMAPARLLVEATRVGADTTLAGIARLVEAAQTGKAGVERLADRISAIFVPVVLALATATFVGWWLANGDPSRALGIGIAVLIIACPCALGLATPTAILVGTGRGAQLGILIKGPAVLEDTRTVDTIVLDKTGTLTTGHPTLTAVTTDGAVTQAEALRLAAAVESGSEHPLARAVVAAAAGMPPAPVFPAPSGMPSASPGMPPVSLPRTSGFRALTGAGARAVVEEAIGPVSAGTEVTVGRRDLFTSDATGAARPGSGFESPMAQSSSSSGTNAAVSTNSTDGSTIWLGWDGTAHARFIITDTLRPDAARAVRDLDRLGLTAYLLTGDQEGPARAVAEAVGIPADRVRAQVRPNDKYAMVTELQRQGRIVAMVGDGVNDAAALAQADLGIAMGGGTDVAAASADLVLLRGEVSAIPQGIELSRATLRTIKQNLAWAFGYNSAAIPLAMAGLLNPMIAGAAMACSSVLVVTNSLRLRRFGR